MGMDVLPTLLLSPYEQSNAFVGRRLCFKTLILQMQLDDCTLGHLVAFETNKQSESELSSC